MQANHLTIGFVRRGFSPSGGAEAYLKRLGRGVVERGHQVRLYASADWPPNEWNFGPITRLAAGSATAFADEMERLEPRAARRTAPTGGTSFRSSGDMQKHVPPNRSECDVLMSLERIWKCDVYRAGDGVHRAWLERRAEVSGPMQKFGRMLNPKHSATLALERTLFTQGGAGHIIANSKMVKDEIVRHYGFPAEKIDVVYNGVPTGEFRSGAENRMRNRETLGLTSEEIGVLFAGSGWERKGLRFAIEAIEASGKQMRLLVAGRGEERKFRSARVQFLGVVADMPSLYGAADIFLLPTIYDPFSNACLEALAAGLPVITTRANGFSEIIEPGVHGSVIDDSRNIGAMRDALSYWADATRREETRSRNLELATRFDLSANVAQTLAILTSCHPD